MLSPSLKIRSELPHTPWFYSGFCIYGNVLPLPSTVQIHLDPSIGAYLYPLSLFKPFLTTPAGSGSALPSFNCSPLHDATQNVWDATQNVWAGLDKCHPVHFLRRAVHRGNIQVTTITFTDFFFHLSLPSNGGKITDISMLEFLPL